MRAEAAVLADVDPSMTSTVGPTPPAEVAAIARRRFGLDAAVDGFGSERDEVFGLRATDGRRFVLKISNPAEDPALVDFQTKALLHVAARDPALPVPRVVSSLDDRDGEPLEFADGTRRIVRLFTYLDGHPLHAAPRSAGQRRAVGGTLARLARALRDFDHPRADRSLAWDIGRATRIRGLADGIDDVRFEQVRRIFSRFAEAVEPRLRRMRRQIVHNDFNAHNLLVGIADPDRIAGILDFGDIVRTALVCDLAVAACYQLLPGGHPLQGADDVVRGYHEVEALAEEEFGILYDLIATRLAMAVSITEWRAREYPENAAYILKNTTTAWKGLANLSRIGPDEAGAHLRRCCGLEGNR